MEAKIDENKNEEEAEDDDDLEHEFLTNEKDLGEIDFAFSRRGGNGPVASSSSSSSEEREGDEEKKFRFQRFDLEKKTRKRATSKR